MVRTAGAGSSFLAVFIEGPSKCALSCREVDEGYEFSYTPFASGKYLITIKYGNINIAGSPYQSEVTGMYKLTFKNSNAFVVYCYIIFSFYILLFKKSLTNCVLLFTRSSS